MLHIIMFIYSAGGICSKLAARQEFLSVKFIMYYGIVLFILFAYAVAWQQILKRLPLVTAYSNKAVTVIWGLVWGAVIFHESISANKIIGSILIIIGVYFMVSEKDEAVG